MTAGGDVAAAEISDGVDTAQFGEAGGVLQLDGVGRLVIRFVAQGLAVGTDGGDGGGIQAGFPEQGSDGGGTCGSVFPGSNSSAVQFVVARLIEGVECGTQGRRHGLLAVGKVGVAVAVGADERSIDTVETGAGHDADVVVGRRGHKREKSPLARAFGSDSGLFAAFCRSSFSRFFRLSRCGGFVNVCLGGINGFTRFFFHGFTGGSGFIGGFGGDFFRLIDSFTGFFFHGFTGSSSFVGGFAGNFFCFVGCGSGGFFHVFSCGSGGFFALVFGFI